MAWNIAVLLGPNPFIAGDLLRGAAEAAPEVVLSPTDSIDELERVDCDAAILIYARRSLTERAMKAHRIVVATFDQLSADLVPTVLPDELLIGSLAAAHFQEKGFHNVAVLGLDAAFGQLRSRGFLRRAEELGLSVCATTAISMRLAWEVINSAKMIDPFISRLVFPVGVMAATDRLARSLCDRLLAQGRRVPEDAGIIGVDNNEVRTNYGHLSLTSVDVNARAVGAAAVRLAVKCLEESPRRRPKPREVIVRPAGVIARRSTDFLAINDPEVVAALRFIADNYGDEIGVDDVVNRVLISRSSLDVRMKRHIGRTCSDEIARVRLDAACRLLEESDLNITEISARCGYRFLSHFSHSFHRAHGRTPSEHRKKIRAERRSLA